MILSLLRPLQILLGSLQRSPDPWLYLRGLLLKEGGREGRGNGRRKEEKREKQEGAREKCEAI